MITYTPDELKEIIRKHELWLKNDPDGIRADLSGANLSGAYLSGANLSGANLSGADLSGAYLSGADLRRANLSGANLSGAYLSGANLSGANLSGADLSDANLSGANLRRADLSGAYLSGADLRRANLSGANLSGAYLSAFMIIPEKGEFIGFKKCRDDIIAELLIQKSSKRMSSLVGRKCRCSKAKILSLTKKGVNFTEAFSQYDSSFVYKIGKTIKPDSYDDDIRVECSHGIHFFITKKEAEEY